MLWMKQLKKGWAQLGENAITKEEDVQALFNLIDKDQSGALKLNIPHT